MWEPTSKLGALIWRFIWLLIRMIPLYLRDRNINFKHCKAVLIAKVSPCASSTEKAVAVRMQIITTMALAKLYGTPDKYRT